MTQDQYGEGWGAGNGVRDDAAAAETGEYPAGHARPMTRFQKVASALRGGSDREEHDQAAADPVTADATETPETAEAPPAGPPWEAQRGAAAQPRRDYWDEPGASADDRDDAVAVTSPDALVAGTPSVAGTPAVAETPVAGAPVAEAPDAEDHPATVPDVFGATDAGNGITPAPAAEVPGDPGAPEGQGASATLVAGPEASAPADGATGVPGAEVAGTTGRHAAPAVTGMLGDFSDLTYGNLIPDAARYTDQWRQVQYKFVDDPHASVTEAADIIAQVTAKLEAAIQERQRAIEERQRVITEQQRTLRGRWGEGSNADTEVLRETLRMYRTFLDQLIGPRAG